VALAELTVANDGSSAVNTVTLRATLPAGISSFNPNFIHGGASCSGGISVNCEAAEIVAWTLGTVPAGKAVTVSLPLFIAGTTAPGTTIALPGTVLVNAVSTATANASVVVSGTNALSLAVDEDKDSVVPGELLTYTLNYANRLPSVSVTGTTLSFPVPVGTTFVSATGGGTLAGGNVQWSLGSLPASQSGQQQVVVSINSGLAAGSVLQVAAATISGSSGVAESASANAVSRVAATSPLVLGVELNPDPVRPGERGIAQITVSNRGGSPLTGVVLQARIPQGLDSFNPGYITTGGTCIGADSSNNCGSTELMNWNLGVIPAGAGVTVSAPVFVDTATAAGRLLVLETLANDDGSNRAVRQATMATDTNNPLTVSVSEDVDAVPGGSIVQYTLNYGNRATSGNATNTVLSFPLPVEGVLLGSSGGAIVGSNIEWNLGSLAAGAGGRRLVTLSVPGAVPVGSVVRLDAVELRGNVTPGVVPDAQRSRAVSRVEGTKPLGLAMTLAPDPVQPGQTLTATVSVTNASGGTLTGVVLQARVPTSVNSFNPTLLTGGGTCIGADSSNNCGSTELANWAIGTMLTGSTVQVSMPMVVTAGTANGRLITVEARVADDAGRLSTLDKTVLVNPFTDTDGDTVAQLYDNCTTLSNASQCDSDFDGFGNRCDGDLNNNTFTNAQDTTLFRQQLGGASVAPVFNEADLNCNGFVNAQDTTLFRGLLGNPPGPSAQAP